MRDWEINRNTLEYIVSPNSMEAKKTAGFFLFVHSSALQKNLDVCLLSLPGRGAYSTVQYLVPGTISPGWKVR